MLSGCRISKWNKNAIFEIGVHWESLELPITLFSGSDKDIGGNPEVMGQKW